MREVPETANSLLAWQYGSSTCLFMALATISFLSKSPVSDPDLSMLYKQIVLTLKGLSWWFLADVVIRVPVQVSSLDLA